MAALRYPRREAFAQAVAKSPKSGKSWTQCYIDAGYEGEGHVAEVGASRLMSQDEVRSRIDEIMLPAVRKTRVTIESLIEQLDITIADARASKQHSVVVSALALSAKLVGLLRERIEIGGVGQFDAFQSTEEIARAMLDDLDLDDALKGLDDLRDALKLAASNRAQLIGVGGKPKPRLPSQP